MVVARAPPLKIYRSVFNVHRADDRHVELFADSLAHKAAGIAVTTGVKGRASDEDVEFFAFKQLEAAFHSFVGMRGHKVVAANQGVGDLNILGNGIEDIRASKSAIVHGRLIVRHVFTANLSEELVEVVDSFFLHGLLPIE